MLKAPVQSYSSSKILTDELFIDTDENFGITFISDRLALLAGVQAEKLIGSPVGAFLKNHLSGKPLLRSKLRKKKGTFHVKASFSSPDGQVAAHWLVFPVDGKSKSRQASSYSWLGCMIDAQELHDEKFLHNTDLIENVSDCVIAVDLNFNVIAWNRAAEEIYGFSSEEVKGKPLTMYVNYEYFSDSSAKARDILFKTGKWEGEVVFTRKDGEKFYLFSSVNLARDENGDPTGIVAINRNITERKIAELDIKRSEAKFRTLTENAPTIIQRLDREFRYIYSNQTFEKVFSLPLTHIIGKTPEEAGLQGHLLDLFMGAARNVFQEGKTEVVNFEINRPDSPVLNLLTTFVPERNDQEVESILVISSDISDIRRKEEELKSKEVELSVSNQRFSLATKATTDALWEFDVRSARWYVSEEFVSKFGYTSDELKDKTAEWFLNRVKRQDRKRTLEKIRLIIEEKAPFWRDEFHFMCKDGTYKYILDQASILYDDNGRPYKAIGAVQDFTARKAQEAELMRKEKLLSAVAVASNELLIQNDENKIFDHTLSALGKAAEADSVIYFKYLFDVDRNRHYLSLKSEWSVKGCYAQVGNSELHYLEASRMQDLVSIFEKGEIFSAVTPAVNNAWYRQHLADHEVKSVLCIPILAGGQLDGVVCLQQCDHLRVWKKTEINIFKTFVFTLSAAIERNQAYKKLRDSEEKFKALFKNSLDIVLVVDEHLEVKYITPSIEKVLGFPKDVLQRTYWLDLIHPDEKDRGTEELATLMKDPQYEILMTVRVRNAAGQWVWMEAKGQNQMMNLNINGIIISLRDVTERHLAEQKLKEYSDTITGILNSITDGFTAVDDNLTITVWNHIAEKLSGISSADIIGKSLWHFFPETEHSEAAENLRRALSEKVTVNFEYYAAARDCWFDISVYPYEKGLFIYFKDITDKKKQEMLLALEKNVLEINSKPQASLKTTVDHYMRGLQKINPGILCSVLLLDGDHMVHLSAPSLPPGYIRQVDGKQIGPKAGSCGTAMFTRRPVIVDDVSTNILWEDCKQIPLEYGLAACWSIPIISAQDEVMGSFACYHTEPKSPLPGQMALIERTAKLLRVIIENKQSEEQVRISNDRYILATRATNEAIWDWDIKTDFLYWGEGFNTLFGYNTHDKVSPYTFWEAHIHPEDREKVRRSIRDFMNNKSSQLWVDEYRYKKADGKYAIVLNKGYLIYDRIGDTVRMVGSIEDITEKKRLQKELIKQEIDRQKFIAQAVVDAQEKERGEIGKELHDNVNQILSTAKLLLEVAKTNTRERTRLIAKSASQIHNAINEIRNISRSLVPPSISDLGLTESIRDLLDNITVAKTLDVDFTSTGDIEKGIPDKQKLMLFRIIQEQVSNILKHADATKLAIQLRVDNVGIELAILDNGKGFDLENIKSKKGAGLSNIASRVELFNGKVSIITAPGKGCKLIVKVLPAN